MTKFLPGDKVRSEAYALRGEVLDVDEGLGWARIHYHFVGDMRAAIPFTSHISVGDLDLIGPEDGDETLGNWLGRAVSQQIDAAIAEVEHLQAETIAIRYQGDKIVSWIFQLEG